LRDVTGTVPSLPLIASSIMGKKIAAGADAILLDVKVGSGAFMKTLGEARALAETMVQIGRDVNRRCVALLSDMNQPLGQAVGNALEVKEAIDVLHGAGPADVREHCLVAAAYLLQLGRRVGSVAEGRSLAEKVLDSGQAWDKFVALVRAQGGDVRDVEQPARLPAARLVAEVLSPQTAFLSRLDALEVGLASLALGAGRARKSDPIDHAVGVVVHGKVGDRVEAGRPLFTVHANDAIRLEAARERLAAAVAWSEAPVEPLPLFYGVVD
jgi:pyrimidine-nucleoside phosphorylase